MTSGALSSTGYEMCAYTTYGAPTCQSSGAGAPSTPVGYEDRYTDPTGLVYLINRYYDPSLRQFISVDPAYSTTHSLYGYVGSDPVNRSDPSGLCPLPRWMCTTFDDVWHGLRLLATLDISVPVLLLNIALGADCGWNGRFSTVVCYDSPLAALQGQPFTIGSVVQSPWSMKTTAFEYHCFGGLNGWLSHETKHSDQWAIFGPNLFLGLYIDNWLVSEVISTAAGGYAAEYNLFEIWAGLHNGGYGAPNCGCH